MLCPLSPRFFDMSHIDDSILGELVAQNFYFLFFSCLGVE